MQRNSRITQRWGKNVIFFPVHVAIMCHIVKFLNGWVFFALFCKQKITQNLSFLPQVHVSEQGFHEEVPSPPSFNTEDPSQTRESIDNPAILTQDSLRKHTKAQELLYLQETSKEQPHLFHMKSRRSVGQSSRQKRSRPSGHEETTDVFKFARNAKGQRGSGTSGPPGLFMPNFPMTSVDIKVRLMLWFRTVRAVDLLLMKG